MAAADSRAAADEAQDLLTTYRDEMKDEMSRRWPPRPDQTPTGRAILEAAPAVQIAVVRAALALLAARESAPTGGASAAALPAGFRQETSALWLASPAGWALANHWNADACLVVLISQLARRRLPYSAADLCAIVDPLGQLSTWNGLPVRGILRAVERQVTEGGLAPEVREALVRMRDATSRHRRSHAETRAVAAQLDALLAEAPAAGVEIGTDDDWGVAARDALAALPVAERAPWLALLAHAQTATAAKPSAAWLAAARRCIATLGEAQFTARAIAWLGLLGAPSSNQVRKGLHWTPVPRVVPTEGNATLLRGLVWCCAVVDDAALARAVAAAAEACFKKIPYVGARSTKVGNACLYALGTMPGPHGAEQLVSLQRQLKQPSARGRLDATLDRSAAGVGLSRDDLEDRAVPEHGLVDGQRRLPVGPFTAEIVVRGPRQVDVRWLGADGTPLAAEPADAREAHAAERQRALDTADEVRKVLLAQRDRLERVFVTEREWRLADWQRLYLDHPLLGLLARRLIWTFADGDRTALGAWLDGRLVDAADHPLGSLVDATTVRLWHPIASPAAAVFAWREWLERHAVTQPFKQAHREVYLVTDAERAAGAASGRFAGHILRQHQFRALCQERGWRYGLQGRFDSADTATPTLDLPRHSLRTQLDIEAIDEDTMMSAAGLYLYVTTGPVRFRRVAPAAPGSRPERAARQEQLRAALQGGDMASFLAAALEARRAVRGEPTPLADVPPVVFSEVMRDVDLFVGVSSVGADPAWRETAHGRYAEYWAAFAFGDLSPSARTRHTVLERLLPSLSIGPRCTLADRFLVVRGALRTYRVHLGSGNVLMEPNDQYLCLVPRRGPDRADEAGPLYLPFDGDVVLSLILSKAFLLAADSTIADPAIRRQIQPR